MPSRPHGPDGRSPSRRVSAVDPPSDASGVRRWSMSLLRATNRPAFQRSPASSLRDGTHATNGVLAAHADLDAGAKPGALSRLPVIAGGPMVAPWTTQRARRSTHSRKPENRSNAGKSWIPASGRSRTRTWDLFLIRKTFCPLQSSQLELNPCKHVQQRARKTTGGDWSLQAGGPIVAPRPQFAGGLSFDPEADITATIRSDPNAPQACRSAPA